MTDEAPKVVPVAKCFVEGCDKPAFSKGMCNKHYTADYRQRKLQQPAAIPTDLAKRAASAKTTEDWQKIAQSIQPVIDGILTGEVKATAAQVSMVKNIMDRAYGKPMATQADKKVAAGIVILPKLGEGEKSLTCPRCTYNHLNELDRETVKASVKALYESL